VRGFCALDPCWSRGEALHPFDGDGVAPARGYASAMVTVDALTTVISFALLIGVLSIPVWALRRHNRMFPKGFDRRLEPRL
jgi:hypothetical protein